MERTEPLGNGVRIFVSENHHFTTDTILLADFSRPKKGTKAADLGSGCGTIPLLWMRENPPAETFAVEVQDEAVALLKKSIALNLENGKEDAKSITVIHADWNELKGKMPFGYFDVVTCNPPYKRMGSGIENPDGSKRKARHEEESTLDDIISAAEKLLQFSGRFCMCQRPERLTDVMLALRAHDLEPKRLRFVQGRAGKEPKLFLVEARKGGKKGFMQVMPALIVEDENGGFTDEMKEIYGCYKEGNANG